MVEKRYFINADIVRIFAGLAVVFIHVAAPFLSYPPYYGIGGFDYFLLNIFDAVSRVSVPIFIMLSGYLLLRPERSMNFGQFYRRRVMRIGIPFIFWLCIYYAIPAISGIHITLYTIASYFFSANVGVLYFLIIIFELYILTPLLIVFLQHTTKRAHTFLLIAILGFAVLLDFINAFIPAARVMTDKNIVTIFIPYLPYYIGGYYFRDVHLSTTKRILFSLCYWLVLLFVLFSSDNISQNVITAPQRQADNVPELIMSFLLFIIFINWHPLKQRSLPIYVTVGIKNFAACIFGIYLIHVYVLYLLDSYMHLLPGLITFSMLGVVIFKLVIVFCICFFIVHYVRKVHILKALVGN